MPAGQPVVAELSGVLVANTYVTLVNYIGEGMLANINFYLSLPQTNLMTIKITIDGDAPVVLLGTNFGYTNHRDDANTSRKVMSLDWGLIKFATSLKVEYKHTGIPFVRATCFYQTN